MDREAGDHYGADCVFGDFGEMLGEHAAIAEFAHAVREAEPHDPSVIELFGIDRGDFRDGNDQAGLQV